MFDKWQPVEVVKVQSGRAEVIEFKKGEYRIREVKLIHE